MLSISVFKFFDKPKINAQVNSQVGLKLISVPQTIIFLFLAASISTALFLVPLVIIYLRSLSLSIKFLEIGVLSLIINKASKSANCSIASASSTKGSLKILNSYFPDNFLRSTNSCETF